MRMVALIGTSHRYQFPHDPAAGEFGAFVERALAASKFAAIAEECSFEALSQNGTSVSVCKRISDRESLAHRDCDPNNQQRSALRIESEQEIRLHAFFEGWHQERTELVNRASHEIRERYWLKELLDLDLWPTLFVCGANHVELFCQALVAGGLHVSVLAQDWAPAENGESRS
jgi:hypothetical protein